MRKENKKLMLGEEFNENKSLSMDYFEDFKTLGQCYGHWSTAKENIYTYYANLIANNVDNVINYGIRSYNSNIIVLHAIVEKDNKKYYLMITPSYNWFKEV